MQNFAFEFQAVAEKSQKTAKNVRGLLYFAAPCIYDIYEEWLSGHWTLLDVCILCTHTRHFMTLHRCVCQMSASYCQTPITISVHRLHLSNHGPGLGWVTGLLMLLVCRSGTSCQLPHIW